MKQEEINSIVFEADDFGKRLQQFRKNKDMSQAELAEELGVTQGSIGHIETGRNKPGADFLLQLYLKFPAKFGYLLAGDPNDFIVESYRVTEAGVTYEPDADRAHAIIIHLWNEIHALQDENRKLERLLSDVYDRLRAASRDIQEYYDETS